MPSYTLDVDELIAKLRRQSLTEDDSLNDLHVDSDEILLDIDPDTEKDDVAIITPDSDIDLDQPAIIRADDCMRPDAVYPSMRKKRANICHRRCHPRPGPSPIRTTTSDTQR